MITSIELVMRLWNKVDISFHHHRAPPRPSGSALDHRSLPPVFESRCGHIGRLFHLRLRFITFGGRSAHLAYHAHKSGGKAPIIIIIFSSSHISFLPITLVRETLMKSHHSSFLTSVSNIELVFITAPLLYESSYGILFTFEVSLLFFFHTARDSF